MDPNNFKRGDLVQIVALDPPVHMTAGMYVLAGWRTTPTTRKLEPSKILYCVGEITEDCHSSWVSVPVYLWSYKNVFAFYPRELLLLNAA